jgi:SAM-dependent methyltransferase
MHGDHASYVHGYHPRETDRLLDQAGTLEELLHADTRFPPGSRVLEAGCGVGAQTVTLARRSPRAHFTSIDISPASLAAARERVEEAGVRDRVELLQADLLALPFTAPSFDHVFVCFVLEHMERPAHALAALSAQLKPGGSLTVIEGDHGTACFHPDSTEARAAIACQVELQRRSGGNALIGRQLQPLLASAGFEAVHVSPRLVYADATRPALAEGFTRKTFTAMIEGVRRGALAAGLAAADRFDAGLRDLHRTADPGGVFCYTFFKGVGIKPRAG